MEFQIKKLVKSEQQNKENNTNDVIEYKKKNHFDNKKTEICLDFKNGTCPNENNSCPKQHRFCLDKERCNTRVPCRYLHPWDPGFDKTCKNTYQKCCLDHSQEKIRTVSHCSYPQHPDYDWYSEYNPKKENHHKNNTDSDKENNSNTDKSGLYSNKFDFQKEDKTNIHDMLRQIVEQNKDHNDNNNTDELDIFDDDESNDSKNNEIYKEDPDSDVDSICTSNEDHRIRPKDKLIHSKNKDGQLVLETLALVLQNQDRVLKRQDDLEEQMTRIERMIISHIKNTKRNFDV